MEKKYGKYLGEPNKFNMLLLIVVVLDPRYKMSYMSFAIDQLFDLEKTNDGMVLNSISKIKTIHISRHYQHQNINLSCLLHLILRCHL